MESTIKGIRIYGMASAVPKKWMSLKEQFGNNNEADEKAVKKFTKSTGVEGRFLAGPRQTASDLCYAAAEMILNVKDIKRDQVGILVFVSQTEDYRSPATAMVLHHRLKLSESCLAFDVNLGCSGFTCGISIVSSMLLQSDMDYALLLCGDTSAREKNPDEETFHSNSDKMLFGDSGTATLLMKDESAPSMYLSSATDGSEFKTIIVPYEWYRNPKVGEETGVLMDGVAVYNFSTTKAPEMIANVMAKTNTRPEDYDCLVLHQANKLIIDRVAKATGFSDEQNIKSIRFYGNTSSGSIPNTLVYNYGEDEEGMLHCMMCGFGVGLSWSAVECYIDKKDILPQIKTDDYYDDGYHIN